MSRSRIPILGLVLALLLPAGLARAGGRGWSRGPSACRATAKVLATACEREAAEELGVAEAVCLNLADRDARRDCWDEAQDAQREARGECRERSAARLGLCEAPGFAGPYDPQIDPAAFVAVIDNPYAPYAVGSRWVYEKDGAEGLERIVVEVLDETREILGVTCRVVKDTVWLDGELIEDTRDWLAQDADGNVWYFGEAVQNLENGVLANLDGSFEAGVDGAKPGFWMKAAPSEGEIYRQEWAPREAEDVVEVLSLDAPLPGYIGPVRKTRDFTPLEPDVTEFKYYAPGIGMVLEVDPASGEQLELIEYTP